jgi:hypothetical protein
MAAGDMPLMFLQNKVFQCCEEARSKTASFFVGKEIY